MSGQQEIMCGGPSGVKPPSKEVQAVCDKVKSAVLGKVGRNNVDMFVALSYCQQLVSGMNYFVKLQIGEDEYVHVRIYQALGNVEPVLHGFQSGKSATDQVEYFDQHLD